MGELSRRAAGLSILSAGLMPVAARAARPAYVDLSRYQTPLKNQGARNTCITFAALAALEAACNRAGFGQLALSEEFLNHFGKMTWLTTPWSKIVAKGEDGQESQVGALRRRTGGELYRVACQQHAGAPRSHDALPCDGVRRQGPPASSQCLGLPVLDPAPYQ